MNILNTFVIFCNIYDIQQLNMKYCCFHTMLYVCFHKSKSSGSEHRTNTRDQPSPGHQILYEVPYLQVHTFLQGKSNTRVRRNSVSML